MFTKTVFAAAAVATAIVAQPVASANAAQINFQVDIQTPNGTFSIGNGGFVPQQSSLSCWDAKQELLDDFFKVKKVECNGSVYTFEVKEFKFGPWETVKINRYTGDYWYA